MFGSPTGGPLLAAYNQLQRIRQYYEFTDIDVDRYDLKAGRQQVMLATARWTRPAWLKSRVPGRTRTSSTPTARASSSVRSIPSARRACRSCSSTTFRRSRRAGTQHRNASGLFRAATGSITLWSAPVSMSSTDPATMRRLRCVVVTPVAVASMSALGWSGWQPRRPSPMATSCSAVTSAPIQSCSSTARSRSAPPTLRRFCGWTATLTR